MYYKAPSPDFHKGNPGRRPCGRPTTQGLLPRFLWRKPPSTPALRHLFGALESSNVWIDMELAPVAGATPELDGLTNRPTAVFAVNVDGHLCGYDGSVEDWAVATNGPVATGQWMRVTIALD